MKQRWTTFRSTSNFRRRRFLASSFHRFSLSASASGMFEFTVQSLSVRFFCCECDHFSNHMMLAIGGGGGRDPDTKPNRGQIGHTVWSLVRYSWTVKVLFVVCSNTSGTRQDNLRRRRWRRRNGFREHFAILQTMYQYRYTEKMDYRVLSSGTRHNGRLCFSIQCR